MHTPQLQRRPTQLTAISLSIYQQLKNRSWFMASIKDISFYFVASNASCINFINKIFYVL